MLCAQALDVLDGKDVPGPGTAAVGNISATLVRAGKWLGVLQHAYACVLCATRMSSYSSTAAIAQRDAEDWSSMIINLCVMLKARSWKQHSRSQALAQYLAGLHTWTTVFTQALSLCL
jgi:hypothetical protein